MKSFLDPVTVSADVSVDTRLLLGAAGDVTPRHEASEAVATYQWTPGVALWVKRGRESDTDLQEKEKETATSLGVQWTGNPPVQIPGRNGMDKGRPSLPSALVLVGRAPGQDMDAGHGPASERALFQRWGPPLSQLDFGQLLPCRGRRSVCL